MGASSSTNVAILFFEENENVASNLDLNHKTCVRVSDRNIKQISSSALVINTPESQLQKIGDSKGVYGQGQTFDHLISKQADSHRLKSNSRIINQQSSTIQNKEKTAAMSAESESELPGLVPPMDKSANEENSDIKPVVTAEGINKPLDFSEPAISPPKFVQSDNTELMPKIFSLMEHQNPPAGDGIKPLLRISSNNNKPEVPLVDNASFVHHFNASEIQNERRNQPLYQKMKTGIQIPPQTPKLESDQPVPQAVESAPANKPNIGTNNIWEKLSRQMYWNSILRKGWMLDKQESSSEHMENVLSVYNANNELAWQKILKWESLHADECAEPKLKAYATLSAKYSPRARLRSWLGYELPFDRHDWIIDRNGKEVRYIIDYYDGGKLNSNFEFALLDVRPALDSFEALWDRIKVAMGSWTSRTKESAAPVVSPFGSPPNISEPLNFVGKQPAIEAAAETSQNAKPSRFMPYSLSDVENEHEKKNSVS